MIQVIILVGILLVLCIQLGIIEIRGVTDIFSSRRRRWKDDYPSRRRRSRHTTTKSRRERPDTDDDMSVASDDSFGSDISIDDVRPPKAASAEASMTLLKNLKSSAANTLPGRIQGSNLLQQTNTPWGSNIAANDPEAIQCQIMEELGQSRYGGAQLTSMPM